MPLLGEINTSGIVIQSVIQSLKLEVATLRTTTLHAVQLARQQADDRHKELTDINTSRQLARMFSKEYGGIAPLSPEKQKKFDEHYPQVAHKDLKDASDKALKAFLAMREVENKINECERKINELEFQLVMAYFKRKYSDPLTVTTGTEEGSPKSTSPRPF